MLPPFSFFNFNLIVTLFTLALFQSQEREMFISTHIFLISPLVRVLESKRTQSTDISKM